MIKLALPTTLLTLLFLLGNGFKKVETEVHPTIHTAGLEAHEEAAGATLLGQFRATSASWLYLHADLYLHNGVQMRPLSDGEKKAGLKVESAADNEKELDHEELVTSVPSKNRDFRGWIGDVERETNSYKDMSHHHHNDPVATLPLYRLMTWADPHFLEGWTTGATILAWQNTPQGTAKAHAYLEEGLKENPSQTELLVQQAQIYIEKDKKLESAVPLLIQVVQQTRPKIQRLDESEKDATIQAYRWLSLCYKAWNMPKPMHDVAATGLSFFPDDVGLQHLNSLPYK